MVANEELKNYFLIQFGYVDLTDLSVFVHDHQ